MSLQMGPVTEPKLAKEFKVANAVDIDSLKTAAEKAGKPIVFYLRGDNCGPCKRLTPQLNSIAPGLDGKVQLVAIDGEIPENEIAHEKLGRKGGEASLPAVYVVYPGQKPEIYVGGGDRDIAKAVEAVKKAGR
jgi:thioredoxin-like negative regulator of GroEL